MSKWVKSIHVWILQWTNTKWGAWTLFGCAFADASVLGLPTPVFFLTFALINITKAYKYALFATLGMITGAMAGYAIGHFAWITSNGDYTGIANFFFNNIPGFSVDIYDKIHNLFEKWDLGILFLAAALPLPYKIFSISSGVFEVNIFIFCFATLISQGIKFFLLAFLTIKLGPEVKKIFEFKLKPAVYVVVGCIAVVFVIIKLF